MGKGKITRQEHPQDQRRVDELDESFAPRSMRRYPDDPTVKKLRNTELVVVDDGTTRYLAFRLDGDLFKLLATASGDFVKLEGDTMSGQLGSSLAPGTSPFAVISPINRVRINQLSGKVKTLLYLSSSQLVLLVRRIEETRGPYLFP